MFRSTVRVSNRRTSLTSSSRVIRELVSEDRPASQALLGPAVILPRKFLTVAPAASLDFPQRQRRRQRAAARRKEPRYAVRATPRYRAARASEAATAIPAVTEEPHPFPTLALYAR